MRRIVSAVCLLSLGLISQAQVPKQAPTIKITSRLVQVSVVVHNNKGETVQDLTVDDFALFDQGKLQKISTFAKVMDEALPANTIPPPPGFVSNRLAISTGSGPVHLTSLPNSATVVLIDGLNTIDTDQHFAKEALINFLKQIRPNDRVAVYTLKNELRVLHDFTSDTASLLAALDRDKNQGSFLADASSYQDSMMGGNAKVVSNIEGAPTDPNTGVNIFDALNDMASGNVAIWAQSQRVLNTLDALTAIANHLSGMPGRKNLIWLSSSFPPLVGQNADDSFSLDFRTFVLEMQRTLRALNDTGVAIYPVDARGLMGEFSHVPALNASSQTKPIVTGPRGSKPAPVDQRAQQNIFNSQSTMFDIADRTGGRAFMNTNDITNAIRKAVDDARVTYVIGYSPINQNWDNKFRNIKITMNRPGLEARYRKGYFAAPDPAKTKGGREAILSAAVNAPLPSTGLGILAKAAKSPSQDQSHAVISAVLDVRELAFDKNETGQQEANLDMVAMVFDTQHRIISQDVRTVRCPMTPEQYIQTMNDGLNLTVEVSTPPGSDHVRLVFRDMRSGFLGSVDVPLKEQAGGSSKK